MSMVSVFFSGHHWVYSIANFRPPTTPLRPRPSSKPETPVSPCSVPRLGPSAPESWPWRELCDDGGLSRACRTDGVAAQNGLEKQCRTSNQKEGLQEKQATRSNAERFSKLRSAHRWLQSSNTNRNMPPSSITRNHKRSTQNQPHR